MRKGAIRTMRRGGALLLMTMGMVGVWGSLGASTAGAAGTGATPTEANMATQILTYTNEDRAARGYQTLQTSQYLMDMAQAYVEYESTLNNPVMSSTHEDRWGDPGPEWTTAYLHSHACPGTGVCPHITLSPPDNINGSSAAQGTGSPGYNTSGTYELAWRNSPPHWDDLMSPGWDMAGVGMDCATGFADVLTGSTSTTRNLADTPEPKTPNVITATMGTACLSRSTPPPVTTHPTSTTGYRMVAGDGGVFDFGDAKFYGSMGGKPLNKPVVGSAATSTGGGYWEVASDGGIFTFGNAQFHGSMGGKPLNKPVVGMTADPATGGYWEVASDGGIFSFTAPFYGSMGGKPLNQPIVGMSATPTGGGYWEVASDGGIFSFGNAAFHGSATGLPTSPVVGMAATATGGYWLADAGGGVFSFDAPFDGSMGGQPLNQPIAGFAIS